MVGAFYNSPNIQNAGELSQNQAHHARHFVKVNIQYETLFIDDQDRRWVIFGAAQLFPYLQTVYHQNRNVELRTDFRPLSTMHNVFTSPYALLAHLNHHENGYGLVFDDLLDLEPRISDHTTMFVGHQTWSAHQISRVTIAAMTPTYLRSCLQTNPGKPPAVIFGDLVFKADSGTRLQFLSLPAPATLDVSPESVREAIIKVNYPDLERILDEGGDPNGQAGCFNTPHIIEAIAGDQYRMAKLLFVKGANLKIKCYPESPDYCTLQYAIARAKYLMSAKHETLFAQNMDFIGMLLRNDIQPSPKAQMWLKNNHFVW